MTRRIRGDQNAEDRRAALRMISLLSHEFVEGSPDNMWMLTAPCAVRDDLDFMSEDEGEKAEAKALCGDCKAQAECLSYAEERQVKHGVWGGVDFSQR